MTRTERPGVRADDTEFPASSTFFDLREVRLHAAVAGPEDGPPVILLHGFPEFWYGWRHQIGPLADAGFRVIVPDGRGYNLSAKPAGVRHYRIDTLAADVVDLIDAVGVESIDGKPTAHVVGHDWGAAVAWWVAMHHPDRVRRLCAVNVPHPTVFRRMLGRDWGQRLRSWYVLFFQLPWLPEVVSRAGDWWLPVRAMCESSRPGTFSATDFERYRAAWSQPRAFTAMLNWYRATARGRPRSKRERILPPTLMLWGARDQFLQRSMAEESVDFCEDGRLAVFERATHWIQHEEPARVADALVAFLGE